MNSPALLAERVAVVTGAGRGLGRAQALELARCGARVVVNDLGCDVEGRGQDPHVASSVAAEIVANGGEAVVSTHDVRLAEDCDALVQLALAAFGRVDIAVSNAGILRDWLLANNPVDDFDAVLACHLRAPFLLARAAAGHWRERHKAGEPPAGRLIFVTSASGLYGNVGQAAYGAAKAGVATLARVASLELRRYGVTANAVAPAARTRMTEDLFSIPPGDDGERDPYSPANLAPVVAYLASDLAADVTGQVLAVRAGTIELLAGWDVAAEVVSDRRWRVEELPAAVDRLFDGRSRSYERRAIGLEDFSIRAVGTPPVDQAAQASPLG
ncbi:MAG TPA: SDR family NAD(P)-dependent oxidoreductase [Solirubrobacteraceae bacterium]|jgi:NAD(P)-dependent dehydrogenase (short-subunit alcohol dehydrogenase family)